MVIPTGTKFHKRLLMSIFSAGGFSFQGTNEVKTIGKEGKLMWRKRIVYSRYPLPFSLTSFPVSFPFHLIGTPLNEFKDRR
jgi:hypothetical protein